MSSSSFSYPHPILGNFDDILPELNAEKSVTAQTESDENYHYYQFVMTVEDETILNLISQGKAKYAVHYKCRSTRFEGCEYGTENTVTVKIPRKKVIERIDFRLFVIATESFTYNTPSANPIFMGCSFDIHPNDPLVFFKDQWDDLDITYQVLKHYSSILVPVPDENVKGDDVRIVTDEKIEMHFSKEAYEIFKNVNKPEYTEEIISSYVQTALLTALFQLFTENDESNIKEIDKAWVQAIVKRMKEEPNMPSLEDVVNDPFEEVPSLVQKLLQYPMGSLLRKLNNIVNTEGEDKEIDE